MIKRTALFTVLALCAASASASEGYHLQAGAVSKVPSDCVGGTMEVLSDKINIQRSPNRVTWTLHYEVPDAPEYGTCTVAFKQYPLCEEDLENRGECNDPLQYQCHVATTGDTPHIYAATQWRATISKGKQAMIHCTILRLDEDEDPFDGVCAGACHTGTEAWDDVL